jgi:dTDP-4-dehydrorhamnose reductase
VRVYLTGASGFVGSNVARVFAAHGAELVRPGHEEVDVTDARAVRRSVAAAAPDAVVHAAIWNDPAGLRSDRRRAWDSYVASTRHVVDAANAVGAHVLLVSTDWVFDGTQGPAREDEPPGPINAYGFLKAASELVVAERAERGTVARISGVQGVHRARPQAPRRQDAGFGYLVASIVDALRAGRRFTVWRGEQINMVATPTLATDAAELMWRALERGATGILHCCGGESVDRETLARAVVEAFELDGELLDFGPPDPDALAAGPIPYDTRLDATATAAALGVELPDLRTQLARLRAEIEAARIDLAASKVPPGPASLWGRPGGSQESITA